MLLDTHVWLWYFSDPEQLSQAALIAIESAVKRCEVYVCAVSVWEITLLVRKDRLKLSMTPAEWLAACESLDFLHIVPLDARTLLRAAELNDFHPDPADRFITAYALENGWKLVTKDRRIRDYQGVATVW